MRQVCEITDHAKKTEKGEELILKNTQDFILFGHLEKV